MPDTQLEILEDLRGTFRGELRLDAVTRSVYSTDGSLYQQRPLGVAYPKDAADVASLAKYAGEHHIPLIPRGAGTQVTGAAVGTGLIVDFSRHMRGVIALSEQTVRVQPGIVRDELNAALRPLGRYFPPDPSTTAVTTVGGMLAVDAAGSHAVRVGSTRDHVLSMEVVLAGGTRLELSQETLGERPERRPDELDPLTDPGSSVSEPTVRRDLVGRLRKLLEENAALIEERQPSLMRNCSGYQLRGVMTPTELHLPRLLVGSEGTLGMFTEATLHSAPLPAHRGVALLLFGKMDAAITAVQQIVPHQPSACDLLDRRLLSLGRDADVRFEEWIPKAAEAGILLEQTGYSERQVRDRIQMAVSAVRNRDSSVVVAREAYSGEEVEFLWSLPNRVVPLLSRLLGEFRPLPFVEDIAVPPERLADFLKQAQRVLQKHEITASLYAHAASGQLHLRPFLPQPTQADLGRIETMARDLYEIVFQVGGTISGEHGDGLSRTAFIRSQYGPLYRVFREVKDIFDPHNLMNPGKIISDDPHVTIRRLRTATPPTPQLTDLQLKWSPLEFAQTAERCTNCGTCRASNNGNRMCPLFHHAPIESASPRAKAVVMRDLASGKLAPKELSSDEMKELADLCFNCKQCELECPSEVNIPHLMIEAKASYVAANGLERTDWTLSRAHSFGQLGSRTAPFSNWVLNHRPARWIIEKLLGISRDRKLPAFTRRPFLRKFGQRNPVRKVPKAGQKAPVVYFVDHYVNFHDPYLGRALLAVLEHNGIEVVIPKKQTASGMAMLSAGDLEAAREMADHNLRILCEFARDGYDIVCTEPAAALCLSQEYPRLTNHPDVDLVASKVKEAGAYLWELHQRGELKKDFGPLEYVAGYHTPCHLKALGPQTPFAELTSLIPQLTVHRIDKGCSGMAGAFGLTQKHFQTSLEIGSALMQRMNEPDLQFGITECSSCKLQMQQLTTTPTIHPLKLLALSYGYLPNLQRALRPSTRRLIIR
ncbi:MAG: anaerobic glycerol-3-phosphate dehydrogenase subunit C [Planctomycetaceae bacterium]|nr:anaerobic glycerol-3-phosphate dehydrogenase subunit C [Planctomycetaceae bacterium]